MRVRIVALAMAFAFVGTVARAQLVISGNDGHELEPGQGTEAYAPDSISVIEFDKSRPKLLGSVAAPASLVGAPVGVAISRSGKLALVTSNTKIDPANPTKPAPNDALTVLDLSNPSNPKIVQALHAGLGANGVAMNRAGTLALVANAQDHSVSIYSISHGKLTDAGKVQLDARVNPSDVAFLPDGKGALVSGGPNILRLSVNGMKVALIGAFEPGIRSSNLIVSQNGRYAIVNGSPAEAAPPGAAPEAGAGRVRGPAAAPKVSLIDLSSGAVISQANLDGGVEGIELSPDGRYLAAVVTNGSHSAPTSPGYHDFGLLQVFGVSDTAITSITDAHTGHWCQGAAWSKDDHSVLVQCSVESDLEVFNFDGTTLVREAAATIRLGARPGTIGEQPTR